MAQPPEYLSAAYWNERYRNKETGWDIGAISTPLKAYFDQLTDLSLRILIPGGGNSYEALYLAKMGFNDITIVDVSDVVTKQLSEKVAELGFHSIKILTMDFFDLEGEFDLIIEQTFFCALHPAKRNLYVHTIQKLLSGNGKLVGLLFNREFENNPPFGGNLSDYRQLFSKHLRILTLESCYNSIPARKGNELFLAVTKK